MLFNWEILDDGRFEDTYRAKVHDGWLVRERFGDEGVSITFVPDPRHLWKTDDISLPRHRNYFCAKCGINYASDMDHGCPL